MCLNNLPKVELPEEEDFKQKTGNHHAPYAALAVIVDELHEWECLRKNQPC